MPASVPIVDLSPWFSTDAAARAGVAAQVDAALRSVGFFLVAGHGVSAELPARVRAEARAFFALPAAAKQQYAVTVAGRGWLPTGVEGNGYAEGTETPPDLKESFAVGADRVRTAGEPGPLQMIQQGVHGRCPRAGRAADNVTVNHDRARLILHPH